MRFLTLTCLVFLCVSVALAKPLVGSPMGFDIKKANQQFDRINLQLSVQNLNVNNLDSAVNTLTGLTTEAEQCVEDMQKKINGVDTLIKQGSSSIENKKEGADLLYLDNQHKEFSNEQAQCRLFSIRAKEAIEAYRKAIAELKQEETLTRSVPLWSLMNQFIHSPAETKDSSLLTTRIFTTLPSLLTCMIIAGITLLLSTLILIRLRKSKFAYLYLQFKTLAPQTILLLTLFFISAILFIYLLTLSLDKTTTDLPLIFSGVVFLYFSFLVFISFLFKMKLIRAFFYLNSLDRTFFEAMILTCLSFYTLAVMGQLLSNLFNTQSLLWQISQSGFLLVILATTAYFIHLFCKRHRHSPFIKNHHHFIQRFTALLLLTCALINMMGYQTLAKHLILSGLITFAIIFITRLLSQGISKLYLLLNQNEALKTQIITYFGYKKEQTFTEFLILKTIAQVITVLIGIYLISQSFGFATDYIESIYNQFLYGIHLANITIYPTRIISGIVVFCLLYLVFRAISTSISRHQQFEDEEETQVAVASILTYVGFSLAMISGFLVAGFDFTGLAIIAGALSVGIGLGLQSIVNNFVSGLILLIEKPIRPGDRINVDGVEGFVKKIRVRSTQIITPSREDIIVPNSDLITRRVTNYMFSDKFCRINCEVGVAYGSDTILVRDVLLNLANNHEEVIKSHRNKPVVLFQSFGNSNLIFQLSCLIKDVNKKSTVKSELNFAIDEAFRENKINMAYTTQDINLKMADWAVVKKELEC